MTEQTDDKPRAYTAEEMRDLLIKHFINLARYWAKEPNQSVEQKCEGVVFSILSTLDGCSLDLPGFTIIPSPHEDDKAFYISEGRNWFEAVVINDDSMHEQMHRLAK